MNGTSSWSPRNCARTSTTTTLTCTAPLVLFTTPSLTGVNVSLTCPVLQCVTVCCSVLQWGVCVVLTCLTQAQCTCAHTHTLAHTHTHMHAHIHTCIHTSTPTPAPAHIHACACAYTHTHMRLHICTYTHTLTHKYIHLRIHIYKHALAHTHIHTCACAYTRSHMQLRKHTRDIRAIYISHNACLLLWRMTVWGHGEWQVGWLPRHQCQLSCLQLPQNCDIVRRTFPR